MYADLMSSLAAQHTADLRREACADRARALALASLDRCLTFAGRLQASARRRVAAMRPAVPSTCSTC
jgi:hypothetical protein